MYVCVFSLHTRTSKKNEYHEKGHSFQKAKPVYYIDSLHIE